MNLNYEYGNTTGNILNMGFVAKKDDWIYYSNFFDKNKLYKISTDGSKKYRLSNAPAKLINVVNGWIYYTDVIGMTVYKISSEGKYGYDLLHGEYINSDYTDYLLNESNYNTPLIFIDNMNVVNEWIYISKPNSEKLFKIKTDNSKRVTLRDRISYSVNLLNNVIYFIDEYDTRRICTSIDKTLENSLDLYGNVIAEDLFPNYFIVHEKYIFYKNYDNEYWNYYNELPEGGNIYRIDLDGANKVKITDSLVKTFNASGNWIFYVNCDDKYKLYKVMSDGTNNQKLSDKENIKFINIIDDLIFFHSEKEMYKITFDGKSEAIFD